MALFRYAPYFENVVLRKRPYLQKRWCIEILLDPIRMERQGDGRLRFWSSIGELPGYYIRVITLEDGLTIHNAFLDRRFER